MFVCVCVSITGHSAEVGKFLGLVIINDLDCPKGFGKLWLRFVTRDNLGESLPSS